MSGVWQHLPFWSLSRTTDRCRLRFGLGLAQPVRSWLNFRKFRLVSVRHEHVRHAGGYPQYQTDEGWPCLCLVLQQVANCFSPQIHKQAHRGKHTRIYTWHASFDWVLFFPFGVPHSALSDYFHIFRAVRHVFYLLSRWHFAWLTMDAWCE